MTAPKRLIEVDLPIARISAHARRDQNIRKGHLHTMHVWWATRPLAACRAVILATLLPDPADPACPQDFRDRAAELIRRFAQTVVHTRALDKVYLKIIDTTGDEQSAERWRRYEKVGLASRQPETHTDSQDGCPTGAELLLLRRALLDFVADFAAWEAGTDPRFLETARGLVAAAHPDGPPYLLDPFAGAGSIPFEALRVGAQAFASDLNPVAVLINKVALEYLPKYRGRLAEAVETQGHWMLEQARRRLGRYYPADRHGHTPLAYIWARTITCEGPGCGAEVPLLGMLWLSRKAKKKVALRYRGVKSGGTGFQPVEGGFQPVNPWKHPERTLHNRKLPHLQTPEATYFVTFRCVKGRQLPERARDLVLAAITHWHGSRIDLDAAVVMPDHVHLIFRILETEGRSSSSRLSSPLSRLLHSIKSYSATQVNKLLRRTGPLWQDESFDHIIRTADEWDEKIEYVRQNPVKRGLVSKSEEYRWLWIRSQGQGKDRQDACPTATNSQPGGTGFQPDTDRQDACPTATDSQAGGSGFQPDTDRQDACPTATDSQAGGSGFQPDTDRQDACPTVLVEIFEPKREDEVQEPLVRRFSVTCPCCGYTTPYKSVREQLRRRRGGTRDARMVAVITLDAHGGRHYRLPTEADLKAARAAEKALEQLCGTGFQPVEEGFQPVEEGFQPVEGGFQAVNLDRQDACPTATNSQPGGSGFQPVHLDRQDACPTGSGFQPTGSGFQPDKGQDSQDTCPTGPTPLPPVPDEPTPPDGTLGYRINKYGMERWSDVYLPRQALALAMFCRLVHEARDRVAEETNDPDFADAVATCLALAAGRTVPYAVTHPLLTTIRCSVCAKYSWGVGCP